MTLARDVIVGFLSGRSTPICALCLAKQTGLPFIRVVDGWRDLTVLCSDYEVRRGRCGDCREMAEVLSAVG